MNNPIEIPTGLVDRAKAIILKPKDEWPIIAGESATIGSLYTRYAIFLAAIPALAALLGSLLFGYSFLGITYRPSILSALSSAVVQYGMGLISVAVIAVIADMLAPKFGGTSDRISAFKLAIYASTAVWLAGIFSLIPGLRMLSILGLYSGYLFYVGAVPLLKVAQDKAGVFTAAVVVAAIVISLIAGAIVAPVSGLFAPSAPSFEEGNVSGKLSVPGVGSLDVGKLEDAAKQMENATKEGVKPVDVEKLKGFLPEKIGAFTRNSLESSSMGAGNINGSRAEASYSNGDKTINVSITDMAAVGALSGMGAALNVNSERQDNDGFERTYSEDGGMVTERWSNSSHNGSYSKVFANRFTVSVDGDANSFDELKGYAGSIDGAALAALAK
jgi:hypothetical protein